MWSSIDFISNGHMSPIKNDCGNTKERVMYVEYCRSNCNSEDNQSY